MKKKNIYLLLIPLFALALLVGCAPSSPETNTPTPTPPASVRTPPAFNGQLLSGIQTVILHTTKGDVTLSLDASVAPKTVTNFVTLSQAGFYNGLTFHRIIPDFMIQGGDPNGNGSGGASVFGETFEDEISAKSYGLDKVTLKELSEGQQLPAGLDPKMTGKKFLEEQGYVYNDTLKSLPMARGAIAMANRGPNTNGSQFFIITKQDGTPWLEGRHTVFGTVTKGMDVVDAITALPRNSMDQPNEPVTFTVEVVK